MIDPTTVKEALTKWLPRLVLSLESISKEMKESNSLNKEIIKMRKRDFVNKNNQD
jgi:hypothetical protein